MNKIYKKVWNATLAQWVVASELADNRRLRAAGGVMMRGAGLRVLAALMLMGGMPAVYAQAYCVDAAGNRIAATTGTEAVACGLGSSAGINAVAVGYNSVANFRSVAVGHSSVANGYAVAVGYNSQATGSYSVAVGQDSGANTWGVAVGYNSQANGLYSVAVGFGSQATEYYSVAVGFNSQAVTSAVAVGYRSQAATSAVAVGYTSEATGSAAVAVGYRANAAATRSIALGVDSRALQANSTALGYFSGAFHANSVALGANTVTTAENQVHIGNRRLSGVVAGTAGTDAVNVSQLDAARTRYYSVNSTGGGNVNNDGATGTNAIAAGMDAQASDTDAVALGRDAVASGYAGLAFGPEAIAGDRYSIAIGWRAHAPSWGAVAIGEGAQASGIYAMAFGSAATAAQNGIAIGINAAANSDYSIAIGRLAVAQSEHALAIGYQSQASATRALAFGNDAIAGHEDSIALGAGSATTVGAHSYTGAYVGPTSSTGEVNIGGRQITGVAAGAELTDAVNVLQLQEAVASTSRYFQADGRNDGSDDAQASGSHSVAVGSWAAATEAGSVAMGGWLDINNDGQADADETTLASGLVSTALGTGARALSNAATAVGVRSLASGMRSSALGEQATASAENATALGNHSIASATYTVALGSDAHSFQTEATAIGVSSVADAAQGTALGNHATVTSSGVGGVALGAGSVADRGNAVSVGTGASQRQIINVAAGSEATDAVNVSQLQAVSDVANAGWTLTDAGGNATNIGPDGTVTFESDANVSVAQTGADDAGVVEVTLNRDLHLDSVTTGDTVIDTTGVAVGADVFLGATGLVINGGPSVTADGIDAGTLAITNVAAGVNGTDAVNVDQLNDAIAGTPGASYYSVNSTGGGNEDNDGATGTDAIAAGKDASAEGDEAVALGYGAVATGDAGLAFGAGAQALSLNSLAFGAGAVAGHDNSIALGAGSATTVGAQSGYTGAYVGSSDSTGEVNTGGRQVTGVAAGSADTDAVNVSQLEGGVDHAITESNAYTDARAEDVDGAITDLDNRVTGIEGDITGIQDDVTQLDGRLTGVEDSIVDLGEATTEFDARVHEIESGADGMFQVDQAGEVVKPQANGTNAAAGGNDAVASGEDSTAVGNQSTASGNNSAALGQGATASHDNSLALGQDASAGHDNSVALGQGSATTVGAQTDYEAAYVGPSTSAGEVNVGNRTISGVAPGIADSDAANIAQLNAGVNHAIGEANRYTDQRIEQIQNDVWVGNDELRRDMNAAVASALAVKQAPWVPGKTSYYAGVAGYRGQGAVGISLRRTAHSGRWSLEGGFTQNRDGSGAYVGVSGVLGD